MKIQCQRCKEIVEIGPFKPTETGIEISCAACAETFFIPRSGRATKAAATPSTRLEPGDGDSEGGEPSCPKCGAAVAAANDACRACGLHRDHFVGFADGEAADEDPVLESLWQACEADWQSADPHEKFAARASQTGAYAVAARRYRDAQKERPSDDTIAARLERITKMAEVALLSSRPAQIADDGPRAYRGVIAFLVLLLVAATLGGIYTVTKKGEPSKRPAPTSTR